jgi:hypothetical protein
MLVRTIVVALPLVLGAEQDSTGSSQGASDQKPRSEQMGDSVPGHGHASGALGNSSDTTGAEGKGGVGTNSGTEGRERELGAGEGADTTSGAPGGRWDQSGGKTAQGSGAPARGQGEGAKAHAGDGTVAGKVSAVTKESVTIKSGQGKTHTLKLVPETKLTTSGKQGQRAQLAEGQQVRASYAERRGERVAVEIAVTGGASKEGGARSGSENAAGGKAGAETAPRR